MRVRSSLLLAVIGILSTACPPKPAEAPLPPGGLAGAPAQARGTSLDLPGAGVPVPEPSAPAAQLPAGHPPIGGSAAGGGLHGGTTAGGGAGSALPPALTGAGIGGPGPVQESLVSGTVLETTDVTEYTYMRLKTAAGDEWVAVSRTPIAVGDQVSVTSSVVMENFPSRSLNRTFAKLTMGSLVGAPKKP